MLDQEFFDRLTLFVATCDELSREPYFTEDVHESFLEGKYNEDGYSSAILVHPFVLKSAVTTFRKLWLPSELSSFVGKPNEQNGVRDIVFNWLKTSAESYLREPEYALEPSERWFIDRFDYLLQQSSEKTAIGDYRGISSITVMQTIDCWINAEISHAGPKIGQKKAHDKDRHKSREAFKTYCLELGRELFEYLFRVVLRMVGNDYLQFNRKFALPVWEHHRESGMIPSFDAEFALAHKAYSGSNHHIQYRDNFWHLDKENPSETLMRLLMRSRFSCLESILRHAFPRKSAAVEALQVEESIASALKHSGCEIEFVSERPKNENGHPKSFRGSDFHGVEMGQSFYCELHSQRRKNWIIVFTESAGLLDRIYTKLRETFIQERRKQSPRLGDDEWPRSW